MSPVSGVTNPLLCFASFAPAADGKSPQSNGSFRDRYGSAAGYRLRDFAPDAFEQGSEVRAPQPTRRRRITEGPNEPETASNE